MRLPTLVISLLLLSLLAAVPAAAATTSTFALKLSSTKPKTATGLTLNVTATDPAGPNGKPSGLRSLEIKFPKGTRFETTAATACELEAEEVAQRGPGACPSKSKIGTGKAEALTGFSGGVDPILENLTVIYANTGVIIHARPTGALGQTLGLWGGFSGPFTLETLIPPLCLPGGVPPTCAKGDASISKIDLNVKPVKNKRGDALIRTPAKCSGGKWTYNGVLTFADGTVQEHPGSMPCKR
jgi:hypothetical protein